MVMNIKDLKPGNAYIEDNELYLCISNQQQGKLFVKYNVKRKNMRTGSITENTYHSNAKLTSIELETRIAEYSYDAFFMDTDILEFIEIPFEMLQKIKNFLIDEFPIEIISYQDEILGVNLPEQYNYEVISCEEVVEGKDTKTAMIQTGLQIEVPSSIQEGDFILVSTVDGKYVGPAKYIIDIKYSTAI